MFRGYWSARPSLDICQRPSFAHQLSARAAAQRATPGQNVTLDDVRRAPTGERRGTLSVDLGSPDDTRAVTELASCFGPMSLILASAEHCSDTKSKDNSELRSEGGNSKQAGCPLLAGGPVRWAQLQTYLLGTAVRPRSGASGLAAPRPCLAPRGGTPQQKGGLPAGRRRLMRLAALGLWVASVRAQDDGVQDLIAQVNYRLTALCQTHAQSTARAP